MQPQNSPEERINPDVEVGQSKSLTVLVPSETDTSEIEGAFLPSWCIAVVKPLIQGERKRESERVPADSPFACARCKRQRANHCSLCLEQVCGWCHRPDVDHHGGKVRMHSPTKTYIMTEVETGAMIPHCSYGKDADDSYYIHEPLAAGPCLTCGYDGHVYRLMYRDPESAPWYKKGVANEAVCYACGAGDGNREPVLALTVIPVEAFESDYYVIEEEGGKANLYEVNDHFGSKLLVREYPDRAAAQEYLDYQQKMEEVSEKIIEDYGAMVRQWITTEAAETGLEPRLVREFIGGVID